MNTFKDGRYYRYKNSDTIIRITKSAIFSTYDFVRVFILGNNATPIGTISFINNSEAKDYEEVTVEVVDNKIIVTKVKELERLDNLSFDDTFTIPKFGSYVVYKTMAYLQPPSCSVGVFMIQDINKYAVPTLVTGDTMVYIVSKGE